MEAVKHRHNENREGEIDQELSLTFPIALTATAKPIYRAALYIVSAHEVHLRLRMHLIASAAFFRPMLHRFIGFRYGDVIAFGDEKLPSDSGLPPASSRS